MKCYYKQAMITAFTILLLSLKGYNSTAQNQQFPKVDNSIHDRMYELMKKSNAVILPVEVEKKITALNANNPKKAKAVHTQTSILKVMYNPALSKNDINFFGMQILKSSSESIAAINADIQQLLMQTK